MLGLMAMAVVPVGRRGFRQLRGDVVVAVPRQQEPHLQQGCPPWTPGASAGSWTELAV